MITVVKANGVREPFSGEKVFNTCLRMCGSVELAQEVSRKVEGRVYDGIPTAEILNMILEFMSERKPAIAHRVDLRTGLSLLRSKPDFEAFTAHVFEKLGYNVKRNLIVQGFCIEHEIDVLASKGDEQIYIEVKHHMHPYTYVDLDVAEKVWATLLDLREGYEKGVNDLAVSKSLIVTNTKFTSHAYKYARCRGVDLLSWNIPKDRSLEKLIVEFKLYPVTLLKGFDLKVLHGLIDAGYMTVKDLAEANPKRLSKVGLKEEEAKLLVEKSTKVLETLP